MLAIAAFGLPAVSAGLGACSVRTELAAASAVGASEAQPKSEFQDESAATIEWPMPWRAEASGQHGIVRSIDWPLSAYRSAHLGEFHYLHAGEIERSDAAFLAAGLGFEDGFQFQAEGPGSFLFMPRAELMADPDAEPPEPIASDPIDFFKVLIGWDASEQGGPVASERVELERCWFGYYPAQTAEPKGMLVVMPGMYGTPAPIINAVLGSLRADGWSVLRMLAHPSRFTERLEVDVQPGDEARAAQIAAETFGRRAAATAYAVELAIDRAMTRDAALESLPVALMGMSGGAIVLPTVHAWNDDRIDAAVLIAGGANFLEINLRSNYADWIEAAVFDADPSTPEIDELSIEQVLTMSRLYLEAAPLDGHHLAPMLEGKPTLFLHASGDRAVPASLGETLWERAGKPERWTFPVGHELIFAALPFQADRLDRWLTQAIQADPPTAGADQTESD